MRERVIIVYTKSIHHFYVAVDRQECTTFRSFNDQLTGVIIVSNEANVELETYSYKTNSKHISLPYYRCFN